MHKRVFVSVVKQVIGIRLTGVYQARCYTTIVYFILGSGKSGFCLGIQFVIIICNIVNYIVAKVAGFFFVQPLPGGYNIVNK